MDARAECIVAYVEVEGGDADRAEDVGGGDRKVVGVDAGEGDALNHGDQEHEEGVERRLDVGLLLVGVPLLVVIVAKVWIAFENVRRRCSSLGVVGLKSAALPQLRPFAEPLAGK